MIKKMSHVTIWVSDAEEAKKFYTETLGCEVRRDEMVGEQFRWLTVGFKSQPDLEMVLLEPKAGMLLDEESAAQLRSLVEKGVLGAGVFGTNDCRGTYEELKAKGVRFMGEPAERPYGIEAILRDNSGNWFSMTQEKK